MIVGMVGVDLRDWLDKRHTKHKMTQQLVFKKTKQELKKCISDPQEIRPHLVKSVMIKEPDRTPVGTQHGRRTKY